MEKTKRVIGLIACLLLLSGLPHPFVAQAAAGERVKVQVAGMV
ncbi:MAG TPA: hypothetical protein VNN62_00185 [Methylomirabilota bacterium]|jgi:hypothetical protein|nr:hypothetical protein [Methylomirabilota bacterium]